MDRNEMPAMPCCPPDSTTGLETGAPQAIELGPRRSTRRCARCHNHGITDQIKDQEHLCLFEACECHKCIPLSEHYSSLPAERDLKMEQGPYLRRRPTRGRIRRGTTSPRAHGRAKKLGTQARVPIGKENITPQLEAHPYAIPEEESGASVGSSDLSHCSEPFLCPEDLDYFPRPSAARSGRGIFVSVLDSSTLEEATNNFSFEEVTQIPCPAEQAPEASNQALISAFSEWQQKLEAAKALLALRESSPAPSGSISLLQPCVAPAPDGDKGLQPSSPSL